MILFTIFVYGNAYIVYGNEEIKNKEIKVGLEARTESRFYHLYWQGLRGFSDSFKEVEQGLVWIIKEYPHFNRLDVVLDDLGTLYYLRGDFKKSEYYYRQLVVRFKKSRLRFKGYEYIARSMLMRGRHQKLRKKLLKMIKEIDGKGEKDMIASGFENKMYELLGQSYIYGGDLMEGIQFYNRQRNRFGMDTGTLYGLVVSYMNLGWRGEGLKYARKLLKEYPKSLEALFLKKNHSSLLNNLRKKRKRKQVGKIKSKVTREEYELQVGVFGEEGNAKWIEGRLEKKKMKIRRLEVVIKNQTYYKVMVVGLESKKALKEAMRKLEGMGIQFLVKKKEK